MHFLFDRYKSSLFFVILVVLTSTSFVNSAPAKAAQLKTVSIKPDTLSIEQTILDTLDVKDSDIRDVIRMISKGYNVNILLDQDVTGKVTLHLSNVPILEVLQSIATSNGLELVKEGSVYKIKKATEKQRTIIRYVDGKLTIDIQNMDVKDFLKELSSQTAMSIVPDAKATGKLSGKLYQVAFDDGLRALLEGNGFKLQKRKNIYNVLANNTSSDNSSTPMMGRNSQQRSNFYVDYNNGLLSIDVSNGDLEDVVKAIADQSDIEIITYGDIKTEINAKLNGTPLTEALALLLGGTRFTFVQKNNVILIGDRNSATPSGQALSKSELFPLKHIKADNVPSILPKDIPPTNVRVIKEQNALLISGTSEDIVSAKEFLKTIDIPTPQVRIDAVIVEYKENLDKEFGLRAGEYKGKGGGYYTETPGPETRVSKKGTNFELGMGAAFFKKYVLGALNSNFANLGTLQDDFFVVLRFLETQDKAKVLAQPSILTLNGNKASIDVSETQYFKISTGYGENYTLRFQPIKFGITLDITPWISQSGQITAEITPSVSNSEKSNSEGYPNVSARSISTTVRLNDGETLVLGGLIKNQETSFKNKIPILGDIPIIGALFRHSGTTRTKSNLVVYITPHIVTRDQTVNLEEELEKQRIQDKPFLERQIYQNIKNVKDSLKLKNSVSDVNSSDTQKLNTNKPIVITKDSVKVTDTVKNMQSPTSANAESVDGEIVNDSNSVVPIKQSDKSR